MTAEARGEPCSAVSDRRYSIRSGLNVIPRDQEVRGRPVPPILASDAREHPPSGSKASFCVRGQPRCTIAGYRVARGAEWQGSTVVPARGPVFLLRGMAADGESGGTRRRPRIRVRPPGGEFRGPARLRRHGPPNLAQGRGRETRVAPGPAKSARSGRGPKSAVS